MAQAVAAAERFVAANGYTDLPPTAGKVAYETIEWGSKAEILRRRHDTLERRAFAYSRTRRGDKPGWTVVFRYRKREANPRHGRAVTMDIDGGHPRVEHTEVILKVFPRLRARTP